MKRIIISFIAGLAVAGAGTAAAITSTYHNGSTACKAVTGSYGHGFVCTSLYGSGFGVGISNHLVMVTNGSGKVIFIRQQYGE